MKPFGSERKTGRQTIGYEINDTSGNDNHGLEEITDEEK